MFAKEVIVNETAVSPYSKDKMVGDSVVLVLLKGMNFMESC